MGGFFGLGKDISDKYKEETGSEATLINPRFITGLDKELLDELTHSHRLVITLEDGVVEGGFGQTIAGYYGPTEMKVKNYGLEKSFPSDYVPGKLLEENGVSVGQIVADIKKILG